MRISAFKKDLICDQKYAYPALICKVGMDYLIDIPDFDVTTGGNSIPQAIEGARDLITRLCKEMLKKDKAVPLPFSCGAFEMNGLFTFVDVDLSIEK